MRNFTNEAGFTLLETMIAAAILAIAFLSYTALQLSSTRGNATSISITGKANWASDRIERLLTQSYDELASLDVDADGTDQDPLETGQDKDENNNGVVDANENYGLHHNTVATADGNAVSTDADNTYAILWNVAVDKPVPNTITVHVIVTSRKQNATETTEFEYIKAKAI